MIKHLIPFLLAPALTSCAGMQDDKQKHFAASYIIGYSSQLATESKYESAAICGGVGLAKEAYDELDYGGFDEKDLLYDAVGCIAGIYTGDFVIKFHHNEVKIEGKF